MKERWTCSFNSCSFPSVSYNPPFGGKNWWMMDTQSCWLHISCTFKKYGHLSHSVWLMFSIKIALHSKNECRRWGKDVPSSPAQPLLSLIILPESISRSRSCLPGWRVFWTFSCRRWRREWCTCSSISCTTHWGSGNLSWSYKICQLATSVGLIYSYWVQETMRHIPLSPAQPLAYLTCLTEKPYIGKLLLWLSHLFL